MLDLDTAMLHRLDELETDLLGRRAGAQRRGWLGETDGVDVTLEHLRRQRQVSMTTLPTVRRVSSSSCAVLMLGTVRP